MLYFSTALHICKITSTRFIRKTFRLYITAPKSKGNSSMWTVLYRYYLCNLKHFQIIFWYGHDFMRKYLNYEMCVYFILSIIISNNLRIKFWGTIFYFHTWPQVSRIVATQEHISTAIISKLWSRDCIRLSFVCGWNIFFFIWFYGNGWSLFLNSWFSAKISNTLQSAVPISLYSTYWVYIYIYLPELLHPYIHTCICTIIWRVITWNE